MFSAARIVWSVEPGANEGRIMLNNVGEQIRECLRRAEACARKAAAQTDPGLRDDFLQLERRWLDLARSMEFGERLNTFTNYRTKTF
jgi:hypothetical protein